MRLQWFFMVSCFWITNSLGQYRQYTSVPMNPNFGGRGYGGAGIGQPAYSSVAVVTQPASTPSLSSIGGLPSLPAFQSPNTIHVPRAVYVPPSSFILGQPTYVSPTPNTIPGQTFKSTPASIPEEPISKTAVKPSRMLLLPSKKKNPYPKYTTVSRNPASSKKYKISRLSDAKFGSPSLKQTNVTSSDVQPVNQGGNNEDNPWADDQWHAEYDGTYTDSSANHNAPSSLTKVISFLITIGLILYFC